MRVYLDAVLVYGSFGKVMRGTRKVGLIAERVYIMCVWDFSNGLDILGYGHARG